MAKKTKGAAATTSTSAPQTTASPASQSVPMKFIMILIGISIGLFFIGQWFDAEGDDGTTSETKTSAEKKPKAARGPILSPRIDFNFTPAPPVPTPAPTKVSGGAIPMKKGVWTQVFTIQPGQSYRVDYQGEVAIRYNRSNMGGMLFYHDGVGKTFVLLDPRTGMKKKDQLGNPVLVDPKDPGWSHVFQHVQELEYKSLDVDKLLTLDIYQM
jgi:hypothetical protein